MSEIFDGNLHVHYGQAYVLAGVVDWDGNLADCFFQQQNGMCGTATPRVMFLITGLHTGHVGLQVEVSQNPPTDIDDWEDVVEAPFFVDEIAAAEDVILQDWNGNCVCRIPLSPQSYRVRYCAKNMDQGNETDALVDEDPMDFYKLCFWPAEPASDRIIKQQSGQAAYWNDSAQSWTVREIKRRENAVWPTLLKEEFCGLSIEEIIAGVLKSYPADVFSLEEIVLNALSEELEKSDMREACRRFSQYAIEGAKVKKWHGQYINGHKRYSDSLEALAGYPLSIRKKDGP